MPTTESQFIYQGFTEFPGAYISMPFRVQVERLRRAGLGPLEIAAAASDAGLGDLAAFVLDPDEVTSLLKY